MTNSMLLSERRCARLDHIDGHLEVSYEDEQISLALRRIANKANEKPEDVQWFFGRLNGYCQARAISTWFHTADLTATKNWFYAQAKLFLARYFPQHYVGPVRVTTTYVQMAMPALVSGHAGLIDWFAGVGGAARPFHPFYTSDSGKPIELFTNNTQSIDYYTQSFFLALRGEWDELAERGKRILADPPRSGFGKAWIIDHEFFLALAKGDIGSMKDSIARMLTPRQIAAKRGMNGFETGYTEDLISTRTILCLLLAWRHGYPISANSPYVPEAWLSQEPLLEYVDPFEFMADYTV